MITDDWNRYKDKTDRDIIKEIVRRSDAEEEQFYCPSPKSMQLAGSLFCLRYGGMIVSIARKYLRGAGGRCLSPEEVPTEMLLHFRGPKKLKKKREEDDTGEEDDRPWPRLRMFLEKDRDFDEYLGRSTHNWLRDWLRGGAKRGGQETPPPNPGPDKTPSGPSGLEHVAGPLDDLDGPLDSAYRRGRLLEALKACISGGRRNRFEGNVPAAMRAFLLHEDGADSDVIAEEMQAFGIIVTAATLRQWIHRTKECMNGNHGGLYDEYFRG